MHIHTNNIYRSIHTYTLTYTCIYTHALTHIYIGAPACITKDNGDRNTDEMLSHPPPLLRTLISSGPKESFPEPAGGSDSPSAGL